MAIFEILGNLTESHHTIYRVFQAIQNSLKMLVMLVNGDHKASS